MNINSFILFRI